MLMLHSKEESLGGMYRICQGNCVSIICANLTAVNDVVVAVTSAVASVCCSRYYG